MEPDKSGQIARLRAEQLRCAEAARTAPDEKVREFAMLGVADYFVEEMLLLYWMDAISDQLSA